MLSYSLLYLFSFLVPGYLLARALGLDRLALLVCLPLSYTLLVADILLMKAVGANVVVLPLVFTVEVALICAGLVRRRRGRSFSIEGTVSAAMGSMAGWLGSNKEQLYIAAPFFAGLAVYFYWAGPYTEVPADFWSHVGAIQHHYLSLVEQQAFPAVAAWGDLLGRQSEYWYEIQAFLCYAAGITVEQAFGPMAMINSLVILGSVFAFTQLLLRGSSLSNRGRCITAVIATFFFLATFGTNVFSFVRYYTFGPVFFNYILYMIFALLVLDFFGKSDYPKWVYFLLIFVLLILMAVVHLQEAAFAVVLGAATLLYIWFRVSILGLEDFEGCSQGSYSMSRRQLDWIAYIAMFFIVAAIIAARIGLERHDPLAFHRMIPLSEVLPFVRHMFILDPQQQFYDALTPWGFLVLFLFVLHWRRFESNPVLVVGMLSPFYTVLNPLFTDLFLRVSWPQLIWRFLYMMPTAIAAAVIVYQCASLWTRKQHPAKMFYGLAVTTLLVALMFPLDTKYFFSPFSRLQTLKKVPAGNDHRVWADLYDYLKTLNRKYNVLTDPITGYTLRALTQHDYSGAKFHTYNWGGYQEFNFKTYSLSKYKKYNGWLFIINQRDGALSKTGKISHHWHETELQVHRYYLGGLVEFVKAHPEVFKEMWSQDGIAVFGIEFHEEARQSSPGRMAFAAIGPGWDAVAA